MHKRFISIAALLAASALIATGCGGSDDSSSSDEAAPTQAAYITEADAVCAADQKKFEEITADLPNDIEADASQSAISDEIVPLYEEQIAALRDITPPEGDEDKTAAIYDAVEEALTKIKDEPSAIGEPTTFENANTLATDYGLKVCGS